MLNRSKNKLFFCWLLLFCAASHGQSGPGGIGTADGTSSLVLWLDANNITGFNNGDEISSWNDNSGYNHHATTDNPTWSTGSGVSNNIGAPTYNNNESNINGMPSVQFDRSNSQWLEIVSTVKLRPEKTFSVFGVFESTGQDGVDYGTVLTYSSRYASDDNGYVFGMSTPGNTFSYGVDGFKWENNNKGHYYLSGTVQEENSPHIVGMISDGVNSALYEDNIEATQSANGGDDNDLEFLSSDGSGSENLTIGAYMGQWNGDSDYMWDGYISEIIMFTKELNSVERCILLNHLAAKYGQNLTGNQDDIYAQDNSGNGNYDNDVAGIGRIDVNNIHDDSKGSGVVRILNPSNLDDNEFLFWGHDNGLLQATEVIDVPIGVQARLARVWRVSERNTTNTSNVNVGKVDMRWDLTGLGSVTAADLRLLIDTDNDGAFADESVISGATSLGGNIYEFANVPGGGIGIRNNRRFTLATINSSQTPLPIELLDFNAIPIETKYVNLNWQTASESNNDYFTIERSIDGIDWEVVKEVDSQNGNSSNLQNYNAIDQTPYSGLSYYQLKQTDYDGQFSYSNTVAVNLETINPISVYPNPANELITVNGYEREIKDIRIINCLGQDLTRITKFKTLNKKATIDISDLDSGLYMIKVNNTSIKFYKQ